MRLMKAIERLKRHRRKTRWYRVNMQNYARRTLLKVIDGDIQSCLRDQITLDQADVLYSMAGRS